MRTSPSCGPPSSKRQGQKHLGTRVVHAAHIHRSIRVLAAWPHSNPFKQHPAGAIAAPRTGVICSAHIHHHVERFQQLWVASAHHLGARKPLRLLQQEAAERLVAAAGQVEEWRSGQGSEGKRQAGCIKTAVREPS